MFPRRSLIVLVFLAFDPIHAAPAPSPVPPASAALTPVLVDRYGEPLPEGAVARFGTRHWRQDEGRIRVTFSPDGKFIAAAGDNLDRTITLWDAATGWQVGHITQDEYGVRALAFSPDGKRLVSASDRGTVSQWDVDTQEEVQRFTTDHIFYCASVRPDGQGLATVGYPGMIHLWELPDGKETTPFQTGEIDHHTLVVFSPDGNHLFSATHRVVHLWEVATGKEIREFRGYEKDIASLALSPDGTVLATGGNDGTVRLWDVATGEELQRLTDHEIAGEAVAFSPDGKTVASCAYGSVYLWDTVTGTQLRRFAAGPDGCFSIAFSPDGRTLAAGGKWHILQVWEIATGRERFGFAGHVSPVSSVAFAPDGKVLASGGFDSTVRLWDVCTSRELFRHEDEKWVKSVAFSPDGATLVAGCETGVACWNMLAPGGQARHLDDAIPTMVVAFSRDGTVLASATNRNLYVQVTGVDEKPRSLDPPGDSRIRTMALSPDGKWLAAGLYGGHENYCAAVYDLVTETLVHDVQNEEWGALMTFSPDGKMLVFTHRDGTLRSWDPETGEVLRCSDTLAVSPYSLAFAPDGQTLALGNGDGSIALWDVAGWKESRRFEGHQGAVRAVAFSPDGKLLVSGSDDTTILLWDVTGQQRDNQSAAASLKPSDTAARWEALASADMLEAQAALGSLVQVARRQPAVILERVLPLLVRDNQQIQRLLAALDDDRFEVRERASRQLRSLEDLAESALRRTLDSKPSPEVAWRVQKLLDRFDSPTLTVRQLRLQRSVEILERAGSIEARHALAVLAREAPGHWLRDQARDALARVKNSPIER